MQVIQLFVGRSLNKLAIQFIKLQEPLPRGSFFTRIEPMGNLFVYGTLKDPKVQKMVFRRVEAGTPATLDGYKKSKVVINKKTYPAIVHSPKDSIS